MSYFDDKVKCTCCGDLFDPDLLFENGECRDCRTDNELMDELYEISRAEERDRLLEDEQWDRYYYQDEERF